MNLEKRNTFKNDIIFLDGMWGTGKSLLGPIVSGMDRVEKFKIETIYEYISWLHHLKKIDVNGALWMLRTYTDNSQYHNTIGREVNLRWQDDSGLKNAQEKLKLVYRLFGEEGDSKVEKINSDNIAFCAMSHLLMLTPELLTLAYGKRIKVVEMVRHPLYMVNHFSAYLARFESPREFTMSFYHEDTKVPWFAQEWAEKFVCSNTTERAVLCISRLFSWLDRKIESARASGLAVLVLNFEEVVFQPQITLHKLETFLDRRHHPRIPTILKRQKIPRETISQGKGHSTYGWTRSGKSEGDMYSELWAQVQAFCSEELQHDLNKTIVWYNEKYPSPLSQYQQRIYL
jgi:hypothetical protein